MIDILKRLAPQNWNDTMSLVLIIVIPLMWWKLPLRESIDGALIATWTLVVQYYFRKSPPNGGTP